MSSLITLRRKESRAEPGKLRILLISPSYARDKNTMYFPIGLSYVSAFVRQAGYSVVPLNMNHLNADERFPELERILREEAIDVVGITGLTIAFSEIERIIQFIRPRSGARIVLGGGITSCESELVMNTLRPDFMVLSEGELIFLELLNALGRGGDPTQVPGLWFFRDGIPATSGDGKSIGNLDDLPLPDLELFGIREHLAIQSDQQFSYHESHLKASKVMPITASRSCPFRCTFCYHAGMGKYRRHSIPKVVEHIEQCIEQFGVRYFMIYDELFSANKARILEFCDLVQDLGISWYCQLRVDQMDQALLHRMKAAGCHYISYGFESGSDVVLDSMKKKIKAQQIAEAVRMTRAARIGIQANFLFGDPAETEETLAETRRFQEENELYFVDWSAVIPYPGTQLFELALERNQIPDRETFVRAIGNTSHYLWKHMINLTGLSDQRFLELYVELRESNDRNHRKQLTLVEAGAAASPLSSKITVRCPICDHVDQEVVIPYPPEAHNGGCPNLKSPVGVPGINLVCESCLRKHHLVAKSIPHVGEVYARFQAAIDALKARDAEVVVLPAMDRFYGVFAQDVDLEGLRVVSVLDTRDHRIGESFMGSVTERLTPTNARHKPGQVAVILPWVEYEEVRATLLEGGYPPADIICWNQFFADAWWPEREVVRAPEAAAVPRVGFAAPLPERFEQHVESANTTTWAK